MKLILILLPFVVGLIAAILTLFVGGMFISREHKASVSIRLGKPAEAIWPLIAEPEGIMRWRKDVKGVEQLPERNGHPVFREIGGSAGGMAMELVESDPPRRRRTEIADEKLPFGGSWTWELTPEAGGTRLRITEDGFIKPPPFRYIARIMGYDATMRRHLKGLARHLGETGAEVEP